MKTFRIKNNDLDLSTGKLIFDFDLECIRTLHQIRLKTFRGESIYNESLGVPYFQGILGTKGVKLSDLKSLFIDELMKVPGTKAITQMVADLSSDRVLSIKYTAVADTGTFTEELNLEI